MLRFLLFFFAFSLTLPAATSTAWEVSGFNDLLKGRLSGLAVDANGRLGAGPAVRWSAPLDQPAFWAMAPGPDGAIYAATGHSGKIFKITPDGKSSLVWTAPQSEVFALCFDHAGRLFAATSPNGALYRLSAGKAELVWRSAAKYIWALQPSPDGSIFLGTGDGGRVFRYDGRAGTGVYYETGQSNVTSLALSPSGHLYAGTDPNGLLYDISAARRAAVLYDSSLPEIHSIVVAPDGTVYAAGMGGAVASRTAAGLSAGIQTGNTPVVTSPPTVITVTADKSNGVPSDDQAAHVADNARNTQSPAPTSSGTTTGGVTEVAGVEKSAIYRIRTNGSTETLRSSKDDNVYALLLDGDALLFSTDDHGRIYRLENGRISLLVEPGSGETTALLKSGSALYAALSNAARLLCYDSAGTTAGAYESQVHDATSVARWGHLQWHGLGSGVLFRTRTGFSARPDSTWSPWSAPLSQTNSLIQSPPARYIQFRAEWPPGIGAHLDSIAVPYLAQNSAPVVHSVAVTSVVNNSASKNPAATPPAASAAYSITVTDTGDAPAASTATSNSQTVSRLQTTQTQISWQADDPDGDKLVYSIYFRSEDENGWQMIRNHMFENTLLLDPDVFADGRYFFRVIASDAPSNAPEFAQHTELISTPVLIDNTPPSVSILSSNRKGAEADIEIAAHDAASPLRLCEYSLDAGTWQPIESVDGITDSPDEHFRLHLDRLGSAEHLVVFRVYDAPGNAGLAKVVLR
ncbi:MAG TPA: hypothetical protein VHZ55_10845 [Bryobacteraceae bacterium]|nr:hypothetical protein [Bryobacteraceae bacterium]